MKQKKNLKLPKFIGHRGVKNLCPENTLESITKAFEIGLNFVEIDVKISKDQIPILLHDDTLDRTTNGNGSPLNFNYNILRKLDAGKFFYNKKTHHFIPTLADVLNLSRNKKGNLNIELKPNKNYEKINVIKIIELTKKIKDIQIIYSSFDLISFLEISNLFPESNRSFLVDSFEDYSIEDMFEILKKNNANICGLNIKLISKELIKKIKKNDILITVYSDKNITYTEAKKCFDLGVDSIFSDDPTDILNQL